MELNEQQAAAVQHEGGHALVVAAAGTGKTRTIVARALQLLESGVNPSEMVLLTFTRKAAQEMKNRLAERTNVDALFAGTFHKFARHQLVTFHHASGQDRFRVLGNSEQMTLLKECVTVVRADIAEKQKASPGAVHPYAPSDVRSPKEIAGPMSTWRSLSGKYPVFNDYLREFTELRPEEIVASAVVQETYANAKEKQGYRDFDDLLGDFLAALGERPAFKQLVTRGLRHVLVDELQDTDPVQFAILRELAEGATLFGVGDARQSIYRFRGADYHNVRSFSERLHGAVTYPLSLNYRSHSEVCEVANELLKASHVDYGSAMQSHRGPGATLRATGFGTDGEEAIWIAQDILDRKEEKWGELMVMVRMKYQARAIERELLRHKIPYVFVGGHSIFERAHVLDVVSALHAASNHRDSLAWKRFLQLFPGIGPKTAQKIMHAVEANGLVALQTEKLWTIHECIEAIQDGRTPVAQVGHAANSLAPLLAKRYADDWDDRIDHLHLLVELAKDSDSLPDFLDRFSLADLNQGEPEQQEDKVTLVTVHSAKGTEADHCYLIQTQPGSYPTTRTIREMNLGPEGEGEERLEEERRVLYVALTRARRSLTITRSHENPKDQESFFDDIEGHFNPVDHASSRPRLALSPSAQLVTRPDRSLRSPTHFASRGSLRSKDGSPEAEHSLS